MTQCAQRHERCAREKLRLGLDVEKDGVEKSAGYKFDLADLGFLRRQRKLHDFGEE